MAAPKSNTKRPRKAARVAAEPSLTDKLAESAWAQADAALAEALADLDEVETAPDQSARTEALEMLAQSLSRAARRRGLTRIGELGAREAFDPERHESSADAKASKQVIIRARGVARGDEVLVRPRVAPVRPKR